MDKEPVVQQYNGLVSNKKKWAIKPQKKHGGNLNAYC